MALIEVYREAWVYCSCGEQEPLAKAGKALTGHQFIVPGQKEPAHETSVVYELSLMVLSGTLWAASATSDDL